MEFSHQTTYTMKKLYIETKDGSKRAVELDDKLETQIGVRRFMQKDGSGRADLYWVANMMISAKQRARRWSCTKHGDKAAYEQAVAQRQEWERIKEEKTFEEQKQKQKLLKVAKKATKKVTKKVAKKVAKKKAKKKSGK
jgi:hypothetical protein